VEASVKNQLKLIKFRFDENFFPAVNRTKLFFFVADAAAKKARMFIRLIFSS
jgi:hypothetical protein